MCFVDFNNYLLFSGGPMTASFKFSTSDNCNPISEVSALLKNVSYETNASSFSSCVYKFESRYPSAKWVIVGSLFKLW